MRSEKLGFPPYFLHGADYNYEQWLDSPEVLAEDFRLMKVASVNVVSIGIFSWAMLEPVEGQFEFEWLDRLMDRLHENEIHAILATPSGARPAWLSQKYPEIRRVDEYGRREPHQGRHNNCQTSPVYREKCALINTKLAERYKDHPALLLWHVSNEYNGGHCHCDLCYAAFREWLKARYGTLEALNRAWWTTFWSHRYTAWDQIEPLDPSVNGLMLDWQRFISAQTLDFFLTESRPLRNITPHIPITTNFMGPNVGLDYWQFAPHVDVIAWDSYPSWHRDDDVWTAKETSFLHDIHRSYKQGQPFLLMESTPSVTNWQGVCRPKRPSMHQLAALQAVAHGSDSVQYFQWRKSRGSAEKFHGAVVDHGGHANKRVFREVAGVGETLSQLSELVGSSLPSKVALIYDLQNEWAIKPAGLPRSQNIDYKETCIRHYAPFWQAGISVDIIDSTAELEPYQLVIVPMLYMLRAEIDEKLKTFVRNGGIVVGTYLTGLVDEHDLCFLADAPGPLSELFGISRDEQDILHDHQCGELNTISGNSLNLTGHYQFFHYADVISTNNESVEVLVEYGSDFYTRRPAVTAHEYGQGKAFYIASRSDDAFLSDFYVSLATSLQLQTVLNQPLPDGVTARHRQSTTSDYIFLMNFTTERQTIELGDQSFVDVLEGTTYSGSIDLDGYGVCVLRRPKATSPV